jgi:PAS domain S-box-containing protein
VGNTRGAAARGSHGVVGYLGAAALVALTVWARLLLSDYTGNRPVLVMFFVPVLLSAYFWGLGSGWLATVLSALAAAYYLFPPLESFRVERPLDLIQLLFTAGICGLLSWLIEASRRSARVLTRSVTDERTRSILDTALDGVIAMDHQGRIVEFNPAAERTFGHRRGDVVGRALADVIIPADLREAHRAGLARYLATGEAAVLGRRLELNGLRADGSLVPIELSISRIPGEGPPMFAGFVRDLTERRRSERALDESQQLLQAIIDNSPAVIYVKDIPGRYLLVNRRYEEIFDLRREAIIGRTDHELFPKAAADAFRAMDQRVAAAGRPLTEEESAPLEDGPHDYISVKSPLRDKSGEIYAVFGISTDITEGKRAREALRESQEHYQTLAESLPHLVWTCRPDGWCDYLSRQWVEYTGRSEEEQLGYGWAEQLHPDDRDRTQAAWARATERGETYDVEFRLRRTDGVYRWFKTRAVPLRDGAGGIVKWFGSNTDFEDEKQAHEKLQLQLARLSLLDRIARAIGERQDLHSILQVVIRSLEDHLPIDFGAVCSYEPAHEAMTVTCVGVKSQALAMELAMPEQARIGIDQNGLARCVRGDLVYEADTREVAFPFPQRLAKGGLRSLVIAPLMVESKAFGVLVAARREPNAFSSDDCEFLRGLSAHVALAAHQAQLYGALERAYDDLRQTQQAVMQQERLSALGQMASGIAHDINNAISPVTLYTESLLEKEPGLSPRAREHLEIIQRAIDDVAQTVGRMREFYRQREPQLTLAPLRLNRLVQEVVDLTRARWHDIPQQRGLVIDLVTDLQPDLPAIVGVDSEIRDALVNLVFNAIDAMPEGGSLRLRTQSNRPDAAGSPGSGSVQVEVFDTGIGMDEDTRRRCLEPFFTTKGDRGTGLGLAMVYGTMQRHRGDVEIESSLAHGTTICLTFPIAAGELLAPEAPARASAVPSRLRLLIVDDDPLVLKSLADALEGEGHVVVLANQGQAGIDAFLDARARGGPFDAVITDLGMPHVDGRQVAAAVKGASPSTPVVLLTGWGQRLVAEGDIPPHVDHVLNKPAKMRELRDVLVRLQRPGS